MNRNYVSSTNPASRYEIQLTLFAKFRHRLSTGRQFLSGSKPYAQKSSFPHYAILNETLLRSRIATTSRNSMVYKGLLQTSTAMDEWARKCAIIHQPRCGVPLFDSREPAATAVSMSKCFKKPL